jgi:alanyl-tRNA synthetase
MSEDPANDSSLDAGCIPVPAKDEFPRTELIHLTYEGNFQLECDATLLSCKVIGENMVELCLDRTTMHPQGGGQPTDIGIISSADTVVEISKVLVDRTTGVVTHSGTVTKGDARLVADVVHVAVDPKERQILSECHTAGHVVDAAMARCNRIMPPSKVRSVA